MRSLLPIVAAADNFPPYDGIYPAAHPVTLEKYTPFHLCRADYEAGLVPVGLIRPAVLLELQAFLDDSVASPSSSSRKAFELAERGRIEPDGLHVTEVQAVYFAEWAVQEGKMTEVINDLARRWKDEGKFPGPLGGQSSLMLRTRQSVYLELTRNIRVEGRAVHALGTHRLRPLPALLQLQAPIQHRLHPRASRVRVIRLTDFRRPHDG